MQERVLSDAGAAPARNPYLAASAASMLFGCYLISHALKLAPGQHLKLALLIGVLNVYELLLIAGAILLRRRVASQRDGRALLLLEVLFLFDAAFLYSEAMTVDLALGAATACGVALLTGLKATLLHRMLGWPAERRMIALPGLMLGLVLMLPLAFAQLARTGAMSEAAVYVACWIIGLLPPLSLLLAPGPDDPLGLRGALLGGGYVSLWAHVLVMAWTYELGLDLCWLGPALVGTAAFALLRPGPWPLAQRREQVVLGLPGLALLLSLGEHRDLAGRFLGLSISPLRLVLCAAGLTVAAGLWLERVRAYLWATAIGGVLFAAGHTPGAMADRIGLWIGEASRLLRMALPRTEVEWGILAVAAAFVLLGVGVRRSLGRGDAAQSSRSGPPQPS